MGNITSAKSKPAATSIIDVTYADLMVLINGSDLIPSAKYRITDYATVHYMLDGNGGICLDGNLDPYINTGTAEPLIVCAVSANQLDKIAYSALYPQDIIYYDPDPANWLLDLAFGKTDSTLVTGFKGVIYERNDTKNNNKLGYDFRNAKFRRWKSAATAWDAGTTYAINAYCTSEGILYKSMQSANTNQAVTDTDWWFAYADLSNFEYWFYKDTSGTYIDCLTFHENGSTYSGSCYDNILMNLIDDTAKNIATKSILQNNVFVLDDIQNGMQVCYNNLNSYCYNNTILAPFYSNSIAGNFYKNILDQGCYYNSFGSDFYNNSLGNNAMYNIFAHNISGNIIGHHCNSNTFNGFNDCRMVAYFKKNYCCGDIYGVNFGKATHVYANYNCTISDRADGTFKLSYINNSDVLVITDATA